MTRDQLRKKYLNCDTFNRNRDNKPFLVTKIEPLQNSYLFIVHFHELKPLTTSRPRIMDLISFCKKFH